jgi:hypothetical protein
VGVLTVCVTVLIRSGLVLVLVPVLVDALAGVVAVGVVPVSVVAVGAVVVVLVVVGVVLVSVVAVGAVVVPVVAAVLALDTPLATLSAFAPEPHPANASARATRQEIVRVIGAPSAIRQGSTS